MKGPWNPDGTRVKPAIMLEVLDKRAKTHIRPKYQQGKTQTNPTPTGNPQLATTKCTKNTLTSIPPQYPERVQQSTGFPAQIFNVY